MTVQYSSCNIVRYWIKETVSNCMLSWWNPKAVNKTLWPVIKEKGQIAVE